MCDRHLRHLHPYTLAPWGAHAVHAVRPACQTCRPETVSGLPREFWWLWTSTLVNRLGAFVATFMALYLTLDRGYSPRTPVWSPPCTGSAG